MGCRVAGVMPSQCRGAGCRVLPGAARLRMCGCGHFRVLPGAAGCFRVLPGAAGCCRVLPGAAGLPGCRVAGSGFQAPAGAMF